MILQVCVCPRWGGGYPSMPCRWYPSMPCSRSLGVCAIPACIAGGIPACLATGLQGGAWSGLRSAPGGGLVWGVCSQVGGAWSGGLVSQHALRQTPSPWERRPLLWIVRIPLECILVEFETPYVRYCKTLSRSGSRNFGNGQGKESLYYYSQTTFGTR